MMLQKKPHNQQGRHTTVRRAFTGARELANRRHSVMVRYDMQLSPFTVLVCDPEGNFICEARDRLHYR